MNELFRTTFEHVKPTQEQSDRMREQVMGASFEQREKTADSASHKRFGIRKAAVVAFILLFSITVFAGRMEDLFNGLLKNEKTAREYVEEDIFQDSDGHVQIQVMEFLSDEVTIQMTVKYEALDEEGEAWLESEEIDQWKYEGLSITPDSENKTMVPSHSCGWDELEDYRTSKIRYYFVYCICNNLLPSIHQGQFTYLLSDGLHMERLALPNNVPVYEYALKAVGGEKLSQYYEPTYIRLSKYSFVVYGKNQGLFLTVISENPDYYFSKICLSPEELEQEDLKEVFLVKEDGTKIDGADGWMLGDMESLNLGEDRDCLVTSNTFIEVSEQIRFDDAFADAVDAGEITGLILSNEKKTVEYQFVKEE